MELTVLISAVHTEMAFLKRSMEEAPGLKMRSVYQAQYETAADLYVRFVEMRDNARF